MIREFVRMPIFEKQCVSVGLTEDDVMEIENRIMLNPLLGDMIVGGGGIRKFRYELPNTGKSGGARVVYIDFAYYEKVYLLFAFAKSEADNLTKAETNNLRKLVKILENELGKDG